MGLNQYDTKSSAREGALTEISQYTGIPFVEFVFIATFILECKDSYSNTGKSTIVSTDTGANYIDWRFAKTLNPSTANVNIHNNLGGIQGGESSSFYHSNQPINTTDSVTFSGLTINGNLSVSGTTTTINTVNLQVKDKNIELAISNSPTDSIADGGGITLKGTTDKTFNWVDSTDSWTSSEHLNLANNKVYKIAGTTVLSDSQVLGKNVPSGDIVGTTDTQNLSNKTIDGFTLNGDINSTLYASDIDLIDNNSSAISFDTNGKSGILEIDTTNNVEQVKMSGGLSVTGTSTFKNVTASGTIILNGFTYPVSGGTNGQTLITDGNNNLSFSTINQVHNNLTSIQGGGSGNFYHSNQPINTTDSVNFSNVRADNNLSIFALYSYSSLSGNITSSIFTPGSSTFSISTSSPTTIHGIGWIGDVPQGKLLLIRNSSTSTNIILSNQSTTETTSNTRIITGTNSNYTLAPNAIVFLFYDGETTRWKIVGQNQHNLFSDVQGGENSNYYHSNQPINITDSVIFNGISSTSNLNVTGTSTQSTVNMTTGNVSGTLTFADNNTSGAILNQVKFLTEVNSTVSGTINNVSNSKSSIRFAPTGLLTITGFSAIFTDPSNVNQILSVLNSGAADIILSNESTSSTASSRITTGTESDFTLKPGSGTLLHYDITSTRWRIIGGASSGGSSSNETIVSLNSGSSLNINSSQVFTAYVDGHYDFMVVSDPTISFELFIKNGTPPDATIITSSNSILDSDESGYLCVYISGNNLVLKNNLGYNISLKVSRVTTT